MYVSWRHSYIIVCKCHLTCSSTVPFSALTMRLAVEGVPRSNGGWLRGARAAEKTVSVNGSLMDERGRETESHDLPE